MQRASPDRARRYWGRAARPNRRRRAPRQPKTAVDDEVGPAPHARRDELLDRRVDGRVLAPDAGPGEEPEEAEAPEVPGEGGGGGRRKVNEKRDKEEFFTPETIRQPAEEDGAEHCAGQVGAAGEPDVRVAEAERRAFFERTGERARKRHLQSVQNPADAKRHDDESVEPSPGQPVEARRDVSLNRIDPHAPAQVAPHRRTLFRLADLIKLSR